MNQSIEYKLIGTSDLKAARRIGERVTLIEFTGGNSRAIIETEARPRSTVLIIESNYELYELETIEHKA